MSLKDVLRVVVVDDMSTSRALMAQALDTLGVVSVSHAADAETAWAMVRHDPPDLIVSDMHMPGLTGLDLLDRVRADQVTRSCRFILVSGSVATLPTRSRAGHVPDATLTKPVSLPRLREGIEAAVGRL